MFISAFSKVEVENDYPRLELFKLIENYKLDQKKTTARTKKITTYY